MDEELIPQDFSKIRRARIAERRREESLAGFVVPGLPVDADIPALRKPTKRSDELVPKVLDELLDMLAVKDPFWDMLVAKWSELFPGIPAKPGRKDTSNGTKIFLYVVNSGLLFGLRSKLPSLKKAIAALPGAPKKFTVHLEIHAPARKKK